MCRPELRMAVAGPDRPAPVVVVQDMSSRLPAQRMPTQHPDDAISCIPLDRWDADAIPASNLGGRCANY